MATSLQTLLLPNQSLSFPVSVWHLMIPGRQEAVNTLLAHRSGEVHPEATGVDLPSHVDQLMYLGRTFGLEWHNSCCK